MHKPSGMINPISIIVEVLHVCTCYAAIRWRSCPSVERLVIVHDLPIRCLDTCLLRSTSDVDTDIACPSRHLSRF